jgi:hypothetical protein
VNVKPEARATMASRFTIASMSAASAASGDSSDAWPEPDPGVA